MRIEAFKCDKCGSLVMEATTINLLKTDVDLCPNCVQTLFDALNLNPVKEDVREAVKESPIAEPKADVVKELPIEEYDNARLELDICSDYKKGMTMRAIDKKYGLYNGKTKHVLLKHGMHVSRYHKTTKEEQSDILGMYAEGFPIKEIADAYNVSENTVHTIARKAGIHRNRGISEKATTYHRGPNPKTKAKELWNEGKSIPEIADILNKKESNVKKVLDDLFEKGLLTRKYSVVKKPEPMPIPEKEPERRVRTTVDAQGFVTEVVFD